MSIEAMTGQLAIAKITRRADEPRQDRRGLSQSPTEPRRGPINPPAAAASNQRYNLGSVLTSHALEARCLLSPNDSRLAKPPAFAPRDGDGACDTNLLKLSAAAALDAAVPVDVDRPGECCDGDVDDCFGGVQSAGLGSSSISAETDGRAPFIAC